MYSFTSLYTLLHSVLLEPHDGPPWWRVDLGQEYDVYEVTVYHNGPLSRGEYNCKHM